MSNQTRSPKHARFRSLAFASALSAIAASSCSGAGASNDGAGGANNASGPLYVVATSFITGDQLETHLVTSRTFDESTVIDPSAGPKLLGGVDIVVGGGFVFAPDSNAPVLVRYELDANDRLKKGKELSFAGVGMTSVRGSHVFVVDETKGYVFDPAGPRIVVWNPSTMTLAGKQIDLTEVTREGWSPSLGLGLVNLGSVRRGDQLLVPLTWQDQDGLSRYASGVVTLDTESDTLLGVDDDERCGETFTSIAAPNGDTYFFPPAWSSTQHYFVDAHQPTCVLRVKAGETLFDPDYALDLSALGSGSAAAGAIPDGEGGFLFASVDAQAWESRASDLDGFWRLWHYDFNSGESREVAGLPNWVGHAHFVNLRGEVAFVYWEELASGNRTTFYRANGAADPVQLFSYEASWYSFGRIR
ncbi:MAG: DUF4374 domain-containing protein [Polyangiaceae bacterium]